MVPVRGLASHWRAYLAGRGLVLVCALAGFSAAGTVFVTAENEFAPEFRKCVSEEASYWREHHTYKRGFRVPTSVIVNGVCSVGLVDRHNGLFGLLSALSVALFTYTLWRATVRLAVGADNTSLRQLRAYVLPSGSTSVIHHYNDGLVLDFTVNLANSGTTPAVKTRLWLNRCLLPGELPKDFAFPIPSIIDTASGVIGPRLPIQAATITIMGENFSHMLHDDFRLYVWGGVTYEDFSGTTRITKFCYQTRLVHLEFLRRPLHEQVAVVKDNGGRTPEFTATRIYARGNSAD